tara:strand:+ start:290 stop:2242 length:1953 start_codon:yes stop_codon:yes gene_type:complete
MVPEIGIFSLVVALCFAIIQAFLPLLSSFVRLPDWMIFAKPATYAQALFILIAYICLTWSFINYDFSVVYVARNSNLALPLIYRISGVWGGHEGSMLLWVLILSGWAVAISYFSRNIPLEMVAKVLGVMGLISVGFLLFLLFTSNPFERQLPAPLDGYDLNPLLQDPGLAIHPPMLYMGYVGFSVTFAFAIAALINKEVNSSWARWSRPWTIMAWAFLTIGITLGSWWAYNELGWGGWWFWDPVENASFIPWLVATALIHSLVATEKQGIFAAWSLLLAIFTFSLSLLGTFLVRSGILTSVHAFATDPERGIFILVFLGLIVGGSLLLYSFRAITIKRSSNFSWLSREMALLVNNLLLVVIAATILLGTLYPLILDSLNLGKISVGPPYFNSVFIPLAAPLALLAGIGAMARWRRDRIKRLFSILWLPLTLSFLLGTLWPLINGSGYSFIAVVGGTFGIWTIAASLTGLTHELFFRQPKSQFSRIPKNIIGQTLAHAGIGVFVIGISFSSVYTVEKTLRMMPGDQYSIHNYQYKFEGVEQQNGVNYYAQVGTFTVVKNGKVVAYLYPEKRFYTKQNQPMTEAGIKSMVFGDLYAVLGENLDQNGAWSVRLYYNAFVRWIWSGALLMALGGLLSLILRSVHRRINPIPTNN